MISTASLGSFDKHSDKLAYLFALCVCVFFCGLDFVLWTCVRLVYTFESIFALKSVIGNSPVLVDPVFLDTITFIYGVIRVFNDCIVTVERLDSGY